jgi:hypothetical protein
MAATLASRHARQDGNPMAAPPMVAAHKSPPGRIGWRVGTDGTDGEIMSAGPPGRLNRAAPTLAHLVGSIGRPTRQVPTLAHLVGSIGRPIRQVPTLAHLVGSIGRPIRQVHTLAHLVGSIGRPTRQVHTLAHLVGSIGRPTRQVPTPVHTSRSRSPSPHSDGLKYDNKSIENRSQSFDKCNLSTNNKSI